MLGQQRDADAGPDAIALITINKRRIPQALVELPGEGLGAIAVCIRHKHGEFITAQAGDDVRFASAGAELLGNRAQQCVSRGVAAGVVDLFEVIQIEQQECRRHPGPRHLVKGTRELLHKAMAIDQAGQGVVIGKPA